MLTEKKNALLEELDRGDFIDVTSIAGEAGLKVKQFKFRMARSLYDRLHPDISNKSDEDAVEFHVNLEGVLLRLQEEGRKAPPEQAVILITDVKYSIFEVEQSVDIYASLNNLVGPAVHLVLSEVM